MLTKKQHRVYIFIEHFIAQNGFGPSYRDIADHLGVKTTGSIRKYIKVLNEKGYIANDFNKNRAIVITKKIKAAKGFPLVGKIAAGKPILAFENIEHIDLNAYFNCGNSQYLLEVKGDSMQDAGILNGDWVLIRAQQTADDGEIVVALVDGYEATLKKFKNNQDGTVDLIPENAVMSTMTFPVNRIQIQGIVIAQLRRYGHAC